MHTSSSTKLVWNAPVILICAFCSALVLLADAFTNQAAGKLLFMTYPSSWMDPFTYVRLVLHPLGHSNMSHYLNNMSLFLLLGPVLEKKYGSRTLLIVILGTALCTGLVNSFAGTAAMRGMGGVDFAFVMMLAMTVGKKKQIPVTLLLVILVYGASEAYTALALHETSGLLAHGCGALCGLFFGWLVSGKNQ